MTQTFVLYLVGINVLTFLVYGLDKWKARRRRWRISEQTLLLLAVLGGSIGALLAMHVFHHKTLHKKFRYGVPLILLLQLALCLLMSCASRQKVAAVFPAKELPDPRLAPEHNPNVFLLTYDQETGREAVLKAVKAIGAEIVYDYHSFAGMALKKPANKTLEETMNYFRQVKGVLSVEYDQVIHLTDPVRPVLEKK
jgi:uncharacterized membrane protein YsdA (DUF1294 family)